MFANLKASLRFHHFPIQLHSRHNIFSEDFMKYLYLVASLLFSSASFAKVSVEKVEYKEGDTVLEGLLVMDSAQLKNKKGPGVVVVHDWMGVGPYVQMRAEQLAEMGYVAFVADIYGKGVRPKDPKEAGALAGKYKGDRKLLRARVKAAYDELLKSKTLIQKKSLPQDTALAEQQP